MPRTHHQTHQAGRHLAVAQALLRGYPASLGGQKLSTIEVNGHTAQVQVAGKGAWMIENVDTYVAGTIEIVILVDVSKVRPDFYVAPGDELRSEVKMRHDQFMARVGTRPRNPESKHTKIDPPDVKKWKSHWSLCD